MKSPTRMNRKGFVILSAVFLVAGAFLFAAIPDDPTKPHAPLEFLGVGPEMFADRGSAWVEAIGNVCEKGIAKLGVLAAAVILLVQNIKQKASIQEVKQHVDQRLDNQAKRINDVAIAAAPAVAIPAEPTSTFPVNVQV